MNNKITLFDYNVDWVLKDYHCDPRSTPGKMTREEAIRLFGELGVDGVEVRDEYWGDCTVDYVRRLCEAAGLPIVSYVFFVDLAQPEQRKLQSAIDRVRTMIDRTRALGAGLAMIFPGEMKDGYSADELRKYVIEGLAVCADHAAGAGITLAFENIDHIPWRPIHGTAEQCVEICKQVDSPSLRLISDPCAALFVNQDPVELFKTMAPYVVHMHLKNSRPLYAEEAALRCRDSITGETFTGTVLDGGRVPIAQILGELKRIDYQGYLLVEYQGENHPESVLRYNLEYLRRQMQAL